MTPEPRQSPTLDRGLPPGQRYVRNFPIYDIVSRRPTFDPETWRFRVWGAVDTEIDWSWEDLRALPATEVVADFHCVTKWSKKALRWEGVPTREVLKRVRPMDDAVQVMAHCAEGYTTNVPLAFLEEDDSLLAYALEGEPLSPRHGAPLRLLVPQLYAWKSAKYLTGLEFQTEWAPGFWEERGYHLVGDPWEEQRYWEPVERVREWWRKVRVVGADRTD